MADDKQYREALLAESIRKFPGADKDMNIIRQNWRNDQRVAQGYRTERRGRGGVAGVWDRNKQVIKPIAAAALGLIPGIGIPLAAAAGAAMSGLDRPGKGGVGFDVKAGARGALEGAAAGSVGKFAGSMMAPQSASSFAAAIPGAPAPMAAGTSAVGSIAATPGIAAPAAQGGSWMGNAARSAGNWLTADGGRNAINAAQGAYGIYQQAQGQDRMQDAANRDTARWDYGAPLRDAGRSGMLNPMPADTSSLDALNGIGNPFARPNPAPGAGTLAGNPDAERTGLQLRPQPVNAMRGGMR